jgi:hypothetical protein
MNPGLYEFTTSEYHEDCCPEPSLSRGAIHTLLTKSPLHAWCEHPKLGGKKLLKVTDEMDFGDVAHQLILRKGSGFAVYEGKDWRGKEAAAFWDEAIAAGKTPIKRKDMDRAEAMAQSVRRQLDAFGLERVFRDGLNEQVAVWKEGDTYARCLFDNVIPDLGEIWDLKTSSGSGHPDDIARKLPDLGYDLQDEWYSRGLAAVHPELLGRVKFRFVFVETSYPYAITPYEIDGEGKAIATSKVLRGLRLWQKCTKEGVWPGYATGIVRGVTPEYMLKKELAA